MTISLESRRILWLFSCLALTFMSCTVTGALSSKCRGQNPRIASQEKGVPGSVRPNVLVIVTDDQRYDTLRGMAKTSAWFGLGGTRFTRAFATSPICCPSRASILSGMHVHNHGVLRNKDALRFDPDSSLQRALSDAGYKTAIVGKYLNNWDVERRPEHFDKSAVLLDTGYDRRIYYRFIVGEDGERLIGKSYSTDYVTETAVRYLREFQQEDDERPWFLYVAPFAPHLPALAEKKYRQAPVPTLTPNPAVLEGDRSDKVSDVSDGTLEFSNALQMRERQLRSLESVDDLVDEIMSELGCEDERAQTLAFFISDNGHLWGEHGLSGKRWPYLPSTRIPLLARWPGHFPSGYEDRRLVANIDLAPTIFEAAKVNPTWTIDGRSLLRPGNRKRLLLEYKAINGIPPWASLVSDRYQYIEFYGNDEGTFGELYDLQKDPWQLHNLLRSPRRGPRQVTTKRLSKRLARARMCKGRSCW